MGSSTSSSTASGSTNKGKKVIESKLITAAKTGVLNLSEQNLKASSSIWVKLNSDVLILKLSFLDISGNTLKTFPIEIYHLGNLRTIQASNCSIQRLYDMTSLAKLTTLKLDLNDLESENVGNLPTSLRTINLASNHCVTIPPALQLLPNLNSLDLSRNRLEALIGIGSLSELIELIMDDNNIVEVPMEICQLTKLKTFSLKRNKIKREAVTFSGQSIPKEIFTDTSIIQLDLAENPLRKHDILQFDGVETFLERRKEIKDKNLSGGGLSDYTLFGLE